MSAGINPAPHTARLRVALVGPALCRPTVFRSAPEVVIPEGAGPIGNPSAPGDRGGSEPIDFQLGPHRLDGGDLRRGLGLFDRARLAGGDDLSGQRLD